MNCPCGVGGRFVALGGDFWEELTLSYRVVDIGVEKVELMAIQVG